VSSKFAARGPACVKPKVYTDKSCANALHGFKSLDEMGKAQKKTGKGRLDKYYKLAKYV
jgi:hypothetical protein